MLFKRTVLEGIARGDVTLAFRRWKKPTVSPGTRLRTALGEVIIGAVEPIDDATLSEEQAQKAGFDSLASLQKDLRHEDDRRLYRIEIRGMEADRRTAFREDPSLGTDDATAISEKLAKWDRANGKTGYYRAILDAIGSGEGVPATQLAGRIGVEKLKLKRDVRKLKELGLTESLDVGYRLSPRGKALMDRLGEAE